MKKALLIATILYLVFFSKTLKTNYFFWGSDAENKHYPARVYLYNSLVNDHKFPSWTEKLYIGYPPYVDMELGYLNPVNILFVVLAGPVWSYKILHFLTYLFGCIGFYFILRKRGFSLISYTAAISIYFFSYFNINHLTHSNMVLITMLLPANIALADYFIGKPSLKPFLLQVGLLGYELLWGHPQMSLIVALALITFVLIMWKKSIKDKMKYLAIVFLMSLGIAMPQLFPSMETYLKSSRISDTLDFSNFSLTPELSLSFLYPYMYGSWSYYYGLDISSSFTYVEFNNYVGIVSFMLLVVYLLFGKKDRYYWFLYSLLMIFIFLSYYYSLPIVSKINFPLITLFRYWSRSIILLNLALALGTAKVLNYSELSAKNLNKGIILVSAPFAILLISHFIIIDYPFAQKVHQSLLHLRTEVMLKKDFALWVVLPAASLILLYLGFRNGGTKKNAITIFIVMLIIADLRYFGSNLIPVRLMKWDKLPRIGVPEEFNEKRILQEDEIFSNDQALLYKCWSPHGSSQFLPNSYEQFYLQNHLGDKVRLGKISTTLRLDLNLDNLKKYGFFAVISKDGITQIPNLNKVELIPDPIDASYIIKKEGLIKVKLNSMRDQIIHFSIKYNSNWVVKLNGITIQPGIWDKIFMSVEIPKGESIVEFYYFPKDIFVGLAMGVLLGFPAYFLIRKTLKENN